MTNKKIIYFIFSLCFTTLLLAACRPPMKCIENKSKYFKSTKPKNTASTVGKINTTGAFITLDTTCNRPTFSIIKFNTNQTVQVSTTQYNITQPLKLNNNSYIQYLDSKVSDYYYFNKATQTLTLERFEYWKAPFWNFFVQTNHYLTERFNISGDTLINQVPNRFSRFGRQYLLNENLIENFNRIDNEFIGQHK